MSHGVIVKVPSLMISCLFHYQFITSGFVVEVSFTFVGQEGNNYLTHAFSVSVLAFFKEKGLLAQHLLRPEL